MSANDYQNLVRRLTHMRVKLTERERHVLLFLCEHAQMQTYDILADALFAISTAAVPGRVEIAKKLNEWSNIKGALGRFTWNPFMHDGGFVAVHKQRLRAVQSLVKKGLVTSHRIRGCVGPCSYKIKDNYIPLQSQMSEATP